MKLPYQYVARHVDELYGDPSDSATDEEIDKRCEFISVFIKACGWDEVELLGMMYSNDPQLNQEELNKLN